MCCVSVVRIFKICYQTALIFEWLSIVRCHSDDAELKVPRPLLCLLHLHVAHCDISRIEFSAMNLQTFIYIQGALDSFSPRTKQALALKDAKLYFIGKMCLEFALTSPPNLLPCVQNLIGHSSLSLAVCAFNSLYLMLFSNIFSLS
jgi:hypothetical protein